MSQGSTAFVGLGYSTRSKQAAYHAQLGNGRVLGSGGCAAKTDLVIMSPYLGLGDPVIPHQLSMPREDIAHQIRAPVCSYYITKGPCMFLFCQYSWAGEPPEIAGSCFATLRGRGNHQRFILLCHSSWAREPPKIYLFAKSGLDVCPSYPLVALMIQAELSSLPQLESAIISLTLRSILVRKWVFEKMRVPLHPRKHIFEISCRKPQNDHDPCCLSTAIAAANTATAAAAAAAAAQLPCHRYPMTSSRLSIVLSKPYMQKWVI